MGKCRENAPQKKRCRENEGGRRRRRRAAAEQKRRGVFFANKRRKRQYDQVGPWARPNEEDYPENFVQKADKKDSQL
jgi:hypothetical protein